MAFSLPPGIHLDYRSYHQHTGTGRSDTAGQKSSESEQAGIYPWRACKITFHGNITRNTEKSEKKNNKSKIIIYNTFKNCLCCFACTINHCKRNHHQQNPHKYHMWLMCFPPFSFDQRHHGDAEQQPRKRNAQPLPAAQTPVGHIRSMDRSIPKNVTVFFKDVTPTFSFQSVEIITYLLQITIALSFNKSCISPVPFVHFSYILYFY